MLVAARSAEDYDPTIIADQNHHFVPQLYLRGFLDATLVAKGQHQLWRYRPGGKPVAKGPSGVAREFMFYATSETPGHENETEDVLAQIEETTAPHLEKLRRVTSTCWCRPVSPSARGFRLASRKNWRNCFCVVLPSDPVWKRDYSGSVQRLVRDGVDTPLASLFVHTARAVPPDAEGAGRARSATEEFLFRRLETLSETKGRFVLNESLPIPFDEQGRLEVDLLCADARVAVELDGGQHLGDPKAYRRDRRKDQLLQAHGYFVLRFLAEDVGKCLDQVLDAILRTTSGRRSGRAL